VATALGQIDQLDLELDPLARWLRAFARRQPGCRVPDLPLPMPVAA
jgi:hypothetical protein